MVGSFKPVSHPASLQQSENLNHWMSEKVRFSGGVKLLFIRSKEYALVQRGSCRQESLGHLSFHQSKGNLRSV